MPRKDRTRRAPGVDMDVQEAPDAMVSPDPQDSAVAVLEDPALAPADPEAEPTPAVPIEDAPEPPEALNPLAALPVEDDAPTLEEEFTVEPVENDRTVSVPKAPDPRPLKAEKPAEPSWRSQRTAGIETLPNPLPDSSRVRLGDTVVNTAATPKPGKQAKTPKPSVMDQPITFDACMICGETDPKPTKEHSGRCPICWEHFRSTGSDRMVPTLGPATPPAAQGGILTTLGTKGEKAARTVAKNTPAPPPVAPPAPKAPKAPRPGYIPLTDRPAHVCLTCLQADTPLNVIYGKTVFFQCGLCYRQHKPLPANITTTQAITYEPGMTKEEARERLYGTWPDLRPAGAQPPAKAKATAKAPATVTPIRPEAGVKKPGPKVVKRKK